MISAWLEGDQETIARFTLFGANLRTQLEKKVRSLTMDLVKKVKEEKLSGQVLNKKEGRLSRSITPSFESTDTGFTGIVGTNVSYAARHEFGFTGSEDVKPFTRMMTQAFGKPVKSPRMIQVRAFTRKVNYPEHSFLRSSLNEMREDIRAEIEQTVRETTTGAFKI